MNARALALMVLPLAGPAAAGPVETRAPCGGDAFSSAQVIEHRPPRRGPLAAVPDTLCADLAPREPPVRIEAYPLVAPRVGGEGAGVPYGRGPRPDRP